jgi:hypothetical protein
VKKPCLLSLAFSWLLVARRILCQGLRSGAPKHNVARSALRARIGRHAKVSRFVRATCANPLPTNQQKFARCDCAGRAMVMPPVRSRFGIRCTSNDKSQPCLARTIRYNQARPIDTSHVAPADRAVPSPGVKTSLSELAAPAGLKAILGRLAAAVAVIGQPDKMTSTSG